MTAKTLPSLRWQLAFAFAGVALLTAAVLAGGMLTMLSHQYARAETEFLREGARRALDEPIKDGSKSALRSWTIGAALAAQARVRVYDGAGVLLADSGSPANLDPSMIGGLSPRPGMAAEGAAAPSPASASPETRTTSEKVLRVALPVGAAITGGYLVLSEAPAQGPIVLSRVSQTSLVAGVLAVLAAALTGYLLSRRIARPLSELAQVTDRMAEGDLSVRADAGGSVEVAQLSDSFNTMVAQTGSTMDALRRFLADAAHELGTPLTALQTDLQLAERAASTPDERRLVERSFAQAQRLRSLVDGLLSLSRIEGGTSTPAGTLDVTAAVHSAVDAVASRAEQAGQSLELDAPSGPVCVLADQARFSVIVMNLLDNAIKFTPDGGTISVSLRIDGPEALLAVRDDGVGIPIDEREQVFFRFSRGRGAAGVPGNGLGLAIVKAAVDSMGGAIVVEDAAPGTRFTVRMPLAEVPTEKV